MISRIFTLAIFAVFLLSCKTPSTTTNNGGNSGNVIDYGINSEPVNTTGKQVSFKSEITYDAFQQEAKTNGKPYWVYFYFKGCKPCKRLDAYTFSDPNVIDFSDEKLMAYKVDIEQFSGMDIAEKYKVTEYPTMLFFDTDGNIKSQLSGFVTADVLLAKLKALKM